jgi:hypothetical protein
MKLDAKILKPRHVRVSIAKAPDEHLRSIALAIQPLEQKAELTFQSSGSQLTDEIEKTTVCRHVPREA